MLEIATTANVLSDAREEDRDMTGRQQSSTPRSVWFDVLVFLVGFPVCGALFGYVFYFILDFVTGPYGNLALRLSALLWTSVGLVAGIYAFWLFRRYDKALAKEEMHRD